MTTELKKAMGTNADPIRITKGREHVMAFFDVDQTGLALEETKLDARTFLKQLIDTFYTAEKDGDRIRAAKMIRDTVRENMELSGLLQTGRADLVEEKDGTVRRITIQSRKLVGAMQSLDIDPTDRSVGIYLDPKDIKENTRARDQESPVAEDSAGHQAGDPPDAQADAGEPPVHDHR